MNWWVDFKLWENPLAYVRKRTKDERVQRARNAILSLAYSRGCIVIFVDFEVQHEQKKLPPS